MIRRTPALYATVAAGMLVGLVVVGTYRAVQAQAYQPLGADFQVHLAVARQWLDMGVLYAPAQLAGPYTTADPVFTSGGVVNLYPPPVVLLFAAFLVLPAFLWWAIPLGVVLAMAWYWRPAPWSWPLMVAALSIVPTTVVLVVGNTDMWAMAVVALATRWPAAAVALLGKPVLAPLALVFVRRRRSWIVAGTLAALVALAFLPWWPQYLTATANLAAGHGLMGSLSYRWPGPLLALVPLIPWAARTRRPIPISGDSKREVVPRPGLEPG